MSIYNRLQPAISYVTKCASASICLSVRPFRLTRSNSVEISDVKISHHKCETLDKTLNRETRSIVKALNCRHEQYMNKQNIATLVSIVSDYPQHKKLQFCTRLIINLSNRQLIFLQSHVQYCHETVFYRTKFIEHILGSADITGHYYLLNNTP